MTKSNAYKKNDMGKWVLDYMSKKDFKRVAKRKARQSAKALVKGVC
jgi:hypothetical protein